jgi:hypothetical protein
MTKIPIGRSKQILGATLLAALPLGAALGTAPAASAAAPSVHHAQTWQAHATTEIRANWSAFFAPSTPAERKIALLEDGTKFAAIIRGQSSSALGKTVSAKVTSIQITSHTLAHVRYTISLAGKPVLTGATGTAVYQAKSWKVGDVSFCQLLDLEQVKTPACPVPKKS